MLSSLALLGCSSKAKTDAAVLTQTSPAVAGTKYEWKENEDATFEYFAHHSATSLDLLMATLNGNIAPQIERELGSEHTSVQFSATFIGPYVTRMPPAYIVLTVSRFEEDTKSGHQAVRDKARSTASRLLSDARKYFMEGTTHCAPDNQSTFEAAGCKNPRLEALFFPATNFYDLAIVREHRVANMINRTRVEADVSVDVGNHHFYVVTCAGAAFSDSSTCETKTD